MTTDIGSLASGLDGHVVRLGIGRKHYEKHEALAIKFRRTHFSIVDCVAIAFPNMTTARLLSFNLLVMTLG
jgi:hypothetical protein